MFSVLANDDTAEGFYPTWTHSFIPEDMQMPAGSVSWADICCAGDEQRVVLPLPYFPPEELEEELSEVQQIAENRAAVAEMPQLYDTTTPNPDEVAEQSPQTDTPAEDPVPDIIPVVAPPQPTFSQHWVLWKHDNNRDWSLKSYVKLAVIRTLDELRKSLSLVGAEFSTGGHVYLMLGDIPPIWEDPINKDGGMQNFLLDKTIAHSCWSSLAGRQVGSWKI